ncbi:nucleotidyltransferase domain-containing protein [Pseudomonas sp. KNUC1026]|uniref:nucleotidyltransferase domain-containing protein n=1 Tax=Pseudomonas sp. KNUC1026 TaxID=2893890 RepID=UPI001F35A2C8|nr:nucleotidyltransferase domain-containing protein [Pseudomonas sp. KNUC1026]UFH50449.1 nucleotidyltransferase domain-containing protein [Pseudomonas sp. KNUC1026]
MVSIAVQEEVRNRLRRAEDEHEVKVVLAVESGSRAWGFESPNSDYDARFIYLNKPDWYLSVGLEEQRDVIEYPIVDEMDINGWDLRKALRLFWKSNPGFMEWVQSSIIYEQAGSFHARAKELLPHVYSVEKGIYHYRSMAKTNYRGYLQADQVPLKKYFYVLRPLLSVRWLEQFGTPAPIEFEKLLGLIEREPDVLQAIDELLATKRASAEMGLSPQIAPIQQFVERELNRLEIVKPSRGEPREIEPLLSELFRSVLRETWG